MDQALDGNAQNKMQDGKTGREKTNETKALLKRESSSHGFFSNKHLLKDNNFSHYILNKTFTNYLFDYFHSSLIVI